MRKALESKDFPSTPGRIRTCDLPIRSRLLYPTELRGQVGFARKLPLPNPHDKRRATKAHSSKADGARKAHKNFPRIPRGDGRWRMELGALQECKRFKADNPCLILLGLPLKATMTAATVASQPMPKRSYGRVGSAAGAGGLLRAKNPLATNRTGSPKIRLNTRACRSVVFTSRTTASCRLRPSQV